MVVGNALSLQTPPKIAPKQPPIQMPEYAPGAPGAQPAQEKDELPPLWAIGADGKATAVPQDQAPASNAHVFLVDPPHAARADPHAGTLVLMDGQRIRGTLGDGTDNSASTGAATGGLTWTSTWLPARTLSKEGVRALIIAGDTAPRAEAQDIVMLSNGDRLEGRVVALRAGDVQLEADAITSIPWDRVRSVSFAGPDAAPQGARVWMADGSVLDGATLTWEGADQVKLGDAVKLPRSAILGARQQGAAVLPLSSTTPAVSDALDGRGLRYRLTAPMSDAGNWALDCSPILVEGPVKLSYRAQPTPTVLSLVVALDSSVRGTGVVDVVVRAGGRELHRARLAAATPRSAVSAAVGVQPYEIELLAADGSSVGDVVRFERALLIQSRPR